MFQLDERFKRQILRPEMLQLLSAIVLPTYSGISLFIYSFLAYHLKTLTKLNMHLHILPSYLLTNMGLFITNHSLFRIYLFQTADISLSSLFICGNGSNSKYFAFKLVLSSKLAIFSSAKMFLSYVCYRNWIMRGESVTALRILSKMKIFLEIIK